MIAVYALIVLGGAVRATGASLACPDWPLCGGSILPPLEKLVLIEYAHRLLAAVVGLLVLLCAVFSLWRYRHRPIVVLGAGLAVPLVLAQAAIGREAVLQEMPASLRAAHLGMALLTLGALIVAGVSLWPGAGTPVRGLTGWAMFMAGAVLALNLVGSFVSNLGAGLAYGDWPLFEGKLIPGSHHLAQLHYAHRLLAAVVGLGMVALVWQARRAGMAAWVLSIGALVLYIGQVMMGAANVWLRLETPVRIAHLAFAGAVWGVLVLLVALGLGWLGRRLEVGSVSGVSARP